MLETALITFREGLEAFLIVAITLAYLVKTDRRHLTPAVYAGIAVAVLFSGGMAYLLQGMIENPAMEGGLAMASGVLVASMTLHIMRTAKAFRQKMTAKIDQHASKTPLLALAGIFGFTVLMIAREGMETALMLGSMSSDTGFSGMMAGAVAGLSTVALIGYVWVRNAHLINLKPFLQTTGVFLVLFALHLFLFGAHELSETNALPFVDNDKFHILTEPIDPAYPVGQAITYSLVIVPCLWLAVTLLRDRMQKSRPAFF
jgi:high-affinity iron transporter